MKVRDLTLSKDEYKGRWTEARDATCPCKKCYSAHDCGYINSQGKWIVRMECSIRWNGGCPDNLKEKPEHIFVPGKKKCQRCGTVKLKGETNVY